MTSADVEASEHVWSVEPTPASVADLSEDTWSLLRDEAMRAMRFAYVPYSSYPVGAAALVDDGRIVSGANIENASFGVTLCAECSLVSDLFMSGGGRIVAFDCVDGAGSDPGSMRTLPPTPVRTRRHRDGAQHAQRQSTYVGGAARSIRPRLI